MEPARWHLFNICRSHWEHTFVPLGNLISFTTGHDGLIQQKRMRGCSEIASCAAMIIHLLVQISQRHGICLVLDESMRSKTSAPFSMVPRTACSSHLERHATICNSRIHRLYRRSLSSHSRESELGEFRLIQKLDRYARYTRCTRTHYQVLKELRANSSLSNTVFRPIS